VSEQSTVHPDGWVGDPAELKRARSYRAAIRWGTAPFWLLFVAYWVVVFATDAVFLEWLILFVLGGWVVVNFYLHRQISQIIGRKWTLRLEQKERQSADQPYRQTSGIVDDWLKREEGSDDE